MGEPIYYTCMAQMYQAGVQQLYAIHSNDVAAFESACGVPWEFGAQQYLQGTCIGYWNYLDALTQVLSNTDDQFVAWCSC
jgi:hypothetical protein